MVVLKREGFVPTVGRLGLLVGWSVIAGSALVLSLFATNPLQIGPVGVTLWFLLLLSASITICASGLYGAKVFLHYHPTAHLRLRYSLRQGILLGAWVTVVLALSSLGQLGLRDGILLGLVLVIIELYVRFRWP